MPHDPLLQYNPGVEKEIDSLLFAKKPLLNFKVLRCGEPVWTPFLLKIFAHADRIANTVVLYEHTDATPHSSAYAYPCALRVWNRQYLVHGGARLENAVP